MNPITIAIKRIGQADVFVTVQAGAKVSAALSAAEIDAAGWTFRFEGYNVTINDTLRSSGSLLLTKAIRGN